MSRSDYLFTEIKKLDIELSEMQISCFMEYYEALIEKNKVMNLTAITDFEDVVVKHFVDSLAVVKALGLGKWHETISEDAESLRMVMDLGSGAGFPGIPLKIAFPRLKVVLADSLNKRVVFLNEIIEKLGLEDIYAVHGRAEELARKPEYRDSFDLCVSRAVANMAVLSEYCLPFVKPEGYFVCYKAGGASEEINLAKRAIKLLGGELSEVTETVLPDTDIERTFAVVKKIYATPELYPRKAGMPAKKPL